MKAKNPKLRVETVPVDALRPYDNNAKIHTPEQIEQIKKSIIEFGFGETELEDSEEYDEFCEKFLPKKTADDCYTPEPVYEVVKEWAVNRYNLSGKKIVRPFYPGGDYENENYDGAVVIDNPPFSIISEICGFYIQNKIDFFLFAPGLTLFSTYVGKAKYVTGTNIIYENGAGILTGFVTNLGENKIEIAPELIERIEEANKIETKQTKKKDYPKELITPAIYKLAKRGQALKIKPEEAYFVRKLENQSETSIYGAGFLILERAAAERAAAESENIERFELPEKEKEIVRGLGNE